MHWLEPRLELRSFGNGKGIFAREALPEGTLLCVWGGHVHTSKTIYTIHEELRSHAIQVEIDAFLVPEFPLHDADYFNHSCAANAGFSSSITLVAMRPIKIDEQLCFDYAMSDTAPYDEFECKCGAPNCRERVSADDWKLPELHTAYNHFFSPYVQRLISSLT